MLQQEKRRAQCLIYRYAWVDYLLEGGILLILSGAFVKYAMGVGAYTSSSLIPVGIVALLMASLRTVEAYPKLWMRGFTGIAEPGNPERKFIQKARILKCVRLLLALGVVGWVLWVK